MAWRAIGLLLTMSIACATVFSACAQQSSPTVVADLAFHFDCKAGAYPVSDKAVEQFLQSRGFKVLNVVQARRERKMDPMLSDLFIDGIDQQQRMIRFMAEPLTHGSYSVTLYTRPPTEHATDLEDALLAFVSQTLKCHVRQVARRENGLEAQGAYSDFFKKREDSFRQLEGWRRPPV
jgi:hypothetical protein